MSLFELFIIAVGLSMDAFAVSICMGLSMKVASIKKALIVGLYFGGFQGLMPLIGYAIGSQFATAIVGVDHWVAFILLSIIGGKMVVESFTHRGCADRECPIGYCTDRKCPGGERPNNEEYVLTTRKMITLSIATSIDALAVGVSFAFLNVQIVPAVSFIGVITLTLSFIGVKIGSIFGAKLKSKAEFIGGVILVLMGIKILLEHMGFLG